MQLEVSGAGAPEGERSPEDIRRLLAASAGVLGAPEEGGRRLHDFEVEIAGTFCDAEGRRGAGLDIAHDFHPSPFGEALILTTGGAICGLGFVAGGATQERRAALDDFKRRWPKARFHQAPGDMSRLAADIFGRSAGELRTRVPIVLLGTPFDIAVWQALLRIPMGCLVSYTQIAHYLGQPSASRAVGTANGRNPISFIVPCHRALRSDGTLGGYYWGLDRKRAMIAWEMRWAGVVQ